MNVRAKVTAKGQITIPAEMRRELGLKPGDTINFSKNAQGRYEVIQQTYALADLRGILKHDGPPLSADEIVELVRAARRGEGPQFLAKRKVGFRS